MDPIELPEARALAGRVAMRAQLDDVRLLRLSSELQDFGPVTTLGSDVEMAPQHTEFDEGAHSFVAAVDFTVKITKADSHAEDASDTLVAVIEVSYGALYGLDYDPSMTGDEVQAFVQTVGLLALYPYVRELVQGVTSRMGLPPLVMPIMRQPLLPALLHHHEHDEDGSVAAQDQDD